MTPAGKKRVLFVCIGNACRSQMAEGFARAYGSDVMIAASAGLMPAFRIPSRTLRAMDEKNIDLRDHFPKALRHLGRAEFDLVVNMSGFFLPEEFKEWRAVDWEVSDPVQMEYEEHCEIRDMIEALVMKLVLELRVPPATQFRGQGSGRFTP
ncbi:MAG: arsenate reductase ArsC [Candidatus Solibacter sp.]